MLLYKSVLFALCLIFSIGTVNTYITHYLDRKSFTFIDTLRVYTTVFLWEIFYYLTNK